MSDDFNAENTNSEKGLEDLISSIEALANSEMPEEAGEVPEGAEADADAGEEAVTYSEEDGFEGANTVTLFDEDGAEYTFELIDYVDFEDKLYAILIPEELYDSDDEQVVIMETYFEGDEPNFIFVEDEALAQHILDIYADRDDGDRE